MSGLWKSSSSAEWKPHLDAYRDRLTALNNSKLNDLDRWYFDELPAEVKQRDKPHMTSSELVQLMDWKLTRGKFRPNLLNYVKALPAEDVLQTSQQTFAQLGERDTDAAEPAAAQVQQAIETLSKFKGVGAATASAVLAVYDASVPFMSDEALAAATPGSKEYTVKRYMLLLNALREKAKRLSSAGEVWTAKMVEQALWSEAAQHKKPKAAGKAKAGARTDAASPPSKRQTTSKRS